MGRQERPEGANFPTFWSSILRVRGLTYFIVFLLGRSPTPQKRTVHRSFAPKTEPLWNYGLQPKSKAFVHGRFFHQQIFSREMSVACPGGSQAL